MTLSSRLILLMLLPLAQSTFAAKPGTFQSAGAENGTELRRATFESGRTCEVLLNRKADRNYVPISSAALNRLLANGGHIVSRAESGRADINCHGFSCQILKIPHLPNNVWIEPGDFRTLLFEYFESKSIEWFSFSRNWSGIRSFEQNPNIKANDLVVMALGRMIQHSGVVVIEGGRKLVLSKLDEEMTVVATLENLVERYGIDNVAVFRKKN